MTRVVALTFVVVIGLIVGCNSTTTGPKTTASNPGVLDVSPTAPIPAAQPVAVQPVADAQPVMYSSNTPAESPAITTKKSYTIKKGDTLFSIAKTSYGTGKDWQKIASANPGLNPSKLKVGQQIVIP